MAQGLFIGLTECELLAIKEKAVALITEVKTIMSYSDSGSSASRQMVLPAQTMLAESLFALSRLDPATYGARRTVISTDWQNRQD